jgi:hypothetical protein
VQLSGGLRAEPARLHQLTQHLGARGEGGGVDTVVGELMQQWDKETVESEETVEHREKLSSGWVGGEVGGWGKSGQGVGLGG